MVLSRESFLIKLIYFTTTSHLAWFSSAYTEICIVALHGVYGELLKYKATAAFHWGRTFLFLRMCIFDTNDFL